MTDESKPDTALRACAEAPAPKEQMKDATGWVIERHLHSRLHYWTGRPSSALGVWSEKHADALRFARRADAELMLTYHCNGEGNVVEHLWRAEAPATGLPRYRLVERASSRRNDELVDLLGGAHVYLAADVDALSEARAEAPDHESERLIEHMVNRFLAWRLPEDFTPDGGISFTRDFNEHTAYPMKHEPTGTNLFTATQAEAMVRYMLGAEAPATELQNIVRELKEQCSVGCLYCTVTLESDGVERHEADCLVARLSRIAGHLPITQRAEAPATPRDQILLTALKRVTEHMDRAGGDACGMPECPWCKLQDGDGEMRHSPDCELALARQVIADIEAGIGAEAPATDTGKRWTEVLCTKCGGNGVIKIPGGISQCPRCDGRCYEPEAEALAPSPDTGGKQE